MKATFRNVLPTTLVIAAIFAGGGAMAAGKIGETQMCIDSQRINNTPIIDRRTILVQMRGPREYKRIDLVKECAGLQEGTGFGYSSSINKLCVQDTLKVLEVAGGTCLIDKIVNIDETEAKSLLDRKR